MKIIAGGINQQLLRNVLIDAMKDCIRVRAAVAYAHYDNMLLFDACKSASKPLTFYGRYDHSVPVDPRILKWFLDSKSPGLICKLVPDILHAKVIWWEGSGIYIGSANLSDRAWNSNIECGIYIEHDEMVDQGIDLQMETFFGVTDDKAWSLTEEHYREMKQLSELRAKEIDPRENVLKCNFSKSRLIPEGVGISVSDPNQADQRRLNRFIKEWESTLQLMRDLGKRISEDHNRPSWMKSDVPSGVQADQFLHAYYYQRVRDGASHPYDEFYEENKASPESALKEVVAWWKAGTYEHSSEERTVYDWAEKLRLLLAKDRLLNLTIEEFSRLASMVHAIRDHATKQSNLSLGLDDHPQPPDIKAEAFGKILFAKRSAEGKKAIETIFFVLYGGPVDGLAKRLWMATHSPTWKIPHMGLSSLGEIAGWALPDQFPPRNMRSSKALRALGNDVNIYL